MLRSFQTIFQSMHLVYVTHGVEVLTGVLRGCSDARCASSSFVLSASSYVGNDVATEYEGGAGTSLNLPSVKIHYKILCETYLSHTLVSRLQFYNSILLCKSKLSC